MFLQYGTAVIGDNSNQYGPGMLNYASYTNGSSNISNYQVALNYLLANTPASYIIGVMLGGGGSVDVSNPGYWTSTYISNIKSALLSTTASTKLQFGANYVSGYPAYNAILFDIETGDAGLGNQFIDLFQTAKSLGFKIMFCINHSCPYGFTDAVSLMELILPSTYIDYVVPQLYTENIGTMNEYVSNDQLVWIDTSDTTTTTFVKLLKSNPSYSSQMLIPGLLLYNQMPNSGTGGLFYSGGTNTGNYPNCFCFDGSGSGCACQGTGTPTPDPAAKNYPDGFTTSLDPGANSFICSLFGASSIGGAIQWVNGNYQG